MNGFVMVPNNIAQSRLLDPYEKTILLYLASLNPCFPSLDNISKTLDISLDKVKKSLKKLKELNFVKWDSGKSFKQSNKYEIDLTRCQSPTELHQDSKKTRCQDVRKLPEQPKKTRCQDVIRPSTRACNNQVLGRETTTKYTNIKKPIQTTLENPESALPLLEGGGLQRELPLKTLLYGGGNNYKSNKLMDDLIKWAHTGSGLDGRSEKEAT